MVFLTQLASRMSEPFAVDVSDVSIDLTEREVFADLTYGRDNEERDETAEAQSELDAALGETYH